MRRAALPPSAVVLSAIRGCVDGDNRVLEAAHVLARLHARRAQARDARNEAGVSEATVLASVHQIDEIDCRRGELVCAIDAWVGRRTDALRVAPVHTETIGMIVDRFAQLWTEAQRTLGADGRSSWGVLTELAEGYDELIGDVVEGRRRLPRFAESALDCEV